MTRLKDRLDRLDIPFATLVTLEALETRTVLAVDERTIIAGAMTMDEVLRASRGALDSTSGPGVVRALARLGYATRHVSAYSDAITYSLTRKGLLLLLTTRAFNDNRHAPWRQRLGRTYRWVCLRFKPHRGC